MTKNCSVFLHFYGLTIELRSTDEKIIEDIKQDFFYFNAAPAFPDISIELIDEDPPFSSLPDVKASVYSINYITYHYKDNIFTDYHGRGLRIFNPSKKSYRIYTKVPDLKYEISYLTILSVAGKFLDSRKIHRVHALGINRNGKAILILLPEKGGKTTLALKLLQSEEVKLLSEDSPLINNRGEVMPFPLRLGILPGGEIEIPHKSVREVNFTRVGVKLLVGMRSFADKIGTSSPAHIILIGERSLGNESMIEPASRFNGLKGLIKQSVIGMGLHQGMEYLLGRTIWETFSRSGIALSRLKNSIKVVRQCKVYRYSIGHDPQKNTQVLLRFLKDL